MLDTKAKTVFPKRIRVWSAACSTGQEPYSIAMIFHELLPDINTWDINILATDISDTAIKVASTGRYAAHEIQRGMKLQLLAKYFSKEDNFWKVKDELRSLIAFRQMNLLKSFTNLGPFDIIFCRNVAIYFSPEDKRSLFSRLAEVLIPEGVMFVGSSESLSDAGPQFKPQNHCRSIYYQPNKQAVSGLL